MLLSLKGIHSQSELHLIFFFRRTGCLLRIALRIAQPCDHRLRAKYASFHARAKEASARSLTMSLAFAPHAALPVRHRLRSPAICFTRAAVSPPSAPPPKQPLHLQPPVLEERATPGLADVLRDLADTSGTKRFASPSRGVVQAEWRRHRQGLRYVRHLLGFPLSKLARRLTPVIAFVGAESALAACVEAFSGVTPHLSGQPIALLSGVVGLLLAFRTNASLARYYEARGAWNIIV